MHNGREIMSPGDIERSLDRMACEILEQVPAQESIALIGIQRRGVDLAARLCSLLTSKTDRPIVCGELDINLYRDDWTTSVSTPNINATHIDFPVEDKTIILVDDVLFTGRTVRGALEAILDFGRPRAVKLLVLVDRGHRELPIQADFVGKVVPTSRTEQINVFLMERDGQDRVVLG
ncbi:MAG: bifunctional pyr operon transcriptional regulator/uracil phosphoribosyltransferase PyrR [Desulfovibrionales bacterium]|nr:bifunctional pyr operon transcriptional regulator/uracil phosphoribosyltransferase PyrR [Desulfovibrionales bacterium]